MTRNEMGPWEKIVVASHNHHKIREFRSLFKRECDMDAVGLASYPEIPEIIEDGETFEANALKKAKTVAQTIQLPVVADDSGLEVKALGGAPGVYSARYAGAHGNDEANNQKLLAELAQVPNEARDATFVCVLALVHPEREPIVVRGECPGSIVFEPRGENGFGYDPLFKLDGMSLTMAELTPDEKDRMSHRARAMRLLVDRMQALFSMQ